MTKSGYYNWLHRKFNKSKEEMLFLEENDKIKDMFRATIKKLGFVPGKRTFRTFLLRDYDYKISISRCKKIMNEMNIMATIRRKDAYKGQVKYNHVCASIQNHVNRDFGIMPRSVILTDITYLYFGPKRELFYLCTFKDGYSCEILGYALSKRMNTTLVKEAYENMMKVHGTSFKKQLKVYIHSDQGSQYLSTEFKEILSDDNFIQSCSRRGNSQDNSPMESFFAKLKNAIISLLALCPDYNTACILVKNYIINYNDKHYQYSLGGLAPSEFYEYCISGIYALEHYYGIKKEQLLPITSYLNARDDLIKKKREKNGTKKYCDNTIDPYSIIRIDKNKLGRLIIKSQKEKEQLDIELNRYKALLEDVKIAESFINSANEETINNLSNPNRWLEYNELKYVNKMNGLY